MKQLMIFLFRKFFEIIEILLIRIIKIKDFYQIISDKKYKEYYIKPSKDLKKNRKDGISGFYRVKNEESFLEKSILSHLPFLDEIIIVYNDCSDKTAEIAINLSRKYPEKIKVFEYKPEVYPALSYKHILTPNRSVHGLANYYNFALSKITKKIAVKIDADHISVSKKFEEVCSAIRKKNITTMNYFYGVNIYIENGKNYVNKNKPFTYGLDCGFFPISHKTYFINRKKCESLKLPLKMYLTRKSLGVLFYHLKGIKDSNIVNKDFYKNSKDFLPEHKKNIDTVYNPELISWEEAKRKYNELLNDIPEPYIKN